VFVPAFAAWPAALRQPVSIARADTLLTAIERDRHPEIAKIDVQGGELAVLEGFGDFLTGEAEVSFRKTYEEQPLIENVTEFLMHRGFELIDLQIFGVRSTRAAIQGNAFFVRRELHNQRHAAVDRVFRSVNRIRWPFEHVPSAV
jgi:hypothetical protein